MSVRHFGRSFTGHEIEDHCPCPKAACGLVAGDTETAECGEHAVGAFKTIRQSHDEFDCPEYKPHTVVVTIEARFGIETKFVCAAPEGAPCRKHCPEGCESWIFGEHEHELIDAGECLLLPWLNEMSEATETYVGTRHALVSAPVLLKFVEEWVEWSYLDDAEAVTP